MFSKTSVSFFGREGSAYPSCALMPSPPRKTLFHWRERHTKAKLFHKAAHLHISIVRIFSEHGGGEGEGGGEREERGGERRGERRERSEGKNEGGENWERQGGGQE